jgi:hypothetical protein
MRSGRRKPDMQYEIIGDNNSLVPVISDEIPTGMESSMLMTI